MRAGARAHEVRAQATSAVWDGWAGGGDGGGGGGGRWASALVPALASVNACGARGAWRTGAHRRRAVLLAWAADSCFGLGPFARQRHNSHGAAVHHLLHRTITPCLHTAARCGSSRPGLRTVERLCVRAQVPRGRVVRGLLCSERRIGSCAVARCQRVSVCRCGCGGVGLHHVNQQCARRTRACASRWGCL